MPKTSEETKANSILVRTIEASVEIKFPNETEKRFQDTAFRKAINDLPNLEAGHVLRLHEALCGVEFPSDAALALRTALMSRLATLQGFKAFARPVRKVVSA